MSHHDALTALRRFGLGGRPGELKKIAGDPRGYVLQSLARPALANITDPDLDSSAETYRAAQVAQQQQKIAREAKRESAIETAQRRADVASRTQNLPTAPPPGQVVDMQMAEMQSAKSPPLLKAGRLRNEAYLDEATVRFERHVSTDTALLERLVNFWTNHFCVSAVKGPTRGMVGAYEREAIRPFVLGAFGDMLKAVEQHPAMLIYLDNQLSFGPNSPAGKNQRKGLNENLAREILELHTLGVAGGYKQDDVTNLARMITGWTVGNVNQPGTDVGTFFYHAPRHEPGTWSVMGKAYPDQGRATGEAVLGELAHHPATAQHIAGKLARHFVGDTASPALIARLETSFRETGGDLAVVTRTLILAEEAWTAPARKMVPPSDFVVSLARGVQAKAKAPELLRLVNQLGQPLWSVPSPKGWPDDDQAWAGPSALRERLRIAEMVARQIDKASDPRAVAEDIFGDAMSEYSRQAIARAETRDQGFELLIMTPEFQRR
jgi:uncharacterized protein (DUF1800 family)